ncbi:hypothetical protein AB3X91_03715 [Paraburkholderia sp. BR14263]|uniref:hypothetical protein n=1 Tax=unclassified Paraburkholderia TaxID=2615204 RepID=UPI0034CE5AAE
MSADVQFIGGDRLRQVLQQLADRGSNAEPAMRSVSMTLLRESERIFAAQGKGVGLDEEWQPLSEVTKHRRALGNTRSGRQYGKNGKELKSYTAARSGLMQILVNTNNLVRSLTPAHSSRDARVTTSVEYAATMFYGAKQGQFGRDRRNHPLPWGDIPARRFLPLRGTGSDLRLTEPAERAVIENLMDYLRP